MSKEKAASQKRGTLLDKKLKEAENSQRKKAKQDV